MSRWVVLSVLLGVCCHVIPALGQPAAAGPVGWQGTGQAGAVSAGGGEAVAAGIEILRADGNAADAAVATILALSVTDSTGFCFGGEVPILVYDAQRGLVEVVAGQGTAPRLATQEFFAAQGGIPKSGLLAAAVPAALDACVTTLSRYGTCTFAQVAEPTLRLLDRQASPWHADLAKTIRELCQAESESPEDRIRGLRLVADCFYRGPIARRIDAFCRENGGLIRYNDLATHTTRIEDPVSIQYRGHQIYKCGPWTQGPCALETLQLLEGFDLASMGHNQPDSIHLVIEALKLGLADRDVYYADPLFADVPLTQLLDPAYAKARRGLIVSEQASLLQRPGDPLNGTPLLEADAATVGTPGAVHDTTTCIVADRFGNVVAATPSGWSGVVAGSTGVWLGSRLQSFNSWPGHVNCIEPGKRPRITLTPSLVFKDDRPLLAISVAGGDGQDQASVQLMLNEIEYGLAASESVTAPRFGTNHHLGSFGQTPPELGSLEINEAVGEAVIAELARRGHSVKTNPRALWAPSIIRIDPDSGRLDAAGDPKAGRHAAAY